MVPTPTPPDAADAVRAGRSRPRRGVSGRRRDCSTWTERVPDDVRDPVLSASETDALSTVESHFAGANIERPRTREGAVERMNGGFDAKHRRVIDRLAMRRQRAVVESSTMRSRRWRVSTT